MHILHHYFVNEAFTLICLILVGAVAMVGHLQDTAAIYLSCSKVAVIFNGYGKYIQIAILYNSTIVLQTQAELTTEVTVGDRRSARVDLEG